MFELATLQPENTQISLVEIFETVEGEGTTAGFPTVFVRLFGCPLRCLWCDTPYSYPPQKAEMLLSVAEIARQVSGFSANRVCVTGGEPLLYGDRSALLLQALASLEHICDVHVETSGAMALHPFLAAVSSPKVRYIMDYKLPDSGESQRMHLPNLAALRPQDELKFVIASERDFELACHVLEVYDPASVTLFSPVWGKMEPRELVARMLEQGLANVRLSLQLHKIVWDPNERGV